MSKLLFGNWNTMTLIAISAGAIMFALLTALGNIPMLDNIRLAPAMLVPVVVGGLFGSVPAFIAMFMGSIASDLLMVWGFRFDYAISYGVLGLFVGALPLYGARINEGIFKIEDACLYAFSCLGGTVVSFGFISPYLTSVFYPEHFLGYDIVHTFFEKLSYTLVLVVFGIPLLRLLAYCSRPRPPTQ